ncbi:hypothetical protein PtB15_4B683 [Puccinia triticina]|nr:hypothetical protein PtB15_4B683 [Puccinia triticina]
MSGSNLDTSHITFDLSYSLWVETTPGSYKNICPTKSGSADDSELMCVLPRDLPFERIKAGIFRALGSKLNHHDADLVQILKTADSNKQIELCCNLSNPIDWMQQFVVTDDASFKAFLAREKASIKNFPGCKPKINITMTKPEENSWSGTPTSKPMSCHPPQSPINLTEASGSQVIIPPQVTTSGEPESSSADQNVASTTLSSPADQSRPPKRPRLSQEPSKLDPETLKMEDFLKICHIPPDDKHTRQLITIHRLHHWTVFNHLSVEEMKDLGFSVGPAILINAGASEVKRQVALEAAT